MKFEVPREHMVISREVRFKNNFNLTLTFPHNFRLQNNSLRSRLAVQKQCMGACMVG